MAATRRDDPPRLEQPTKAILDRQVKEQMAMHNIGMGFALTHQTQATHQLLPAEEPLWRPSRTFAKRMPSGSSHAKVPDQ